MADLLYIFCKPSTSSRSRSVVEHAADAARPRLNMTTNRSSSHDHAPRPGRRSRRSERTRLRDIAHIIGVTEQTTPRGSSLDDLAQAATSRKPMKDAPDRYQDAQRTATSPSAAPATARPQKKVVIQFLQSAARAEPYFMNTRLPEQTPLSSATSTPAYPRHDNSSPETTYRYLDGWMPTATHSSSSSAAPQLEDRHYPLRCFATAPILEAQAIHAHPLRQPHTPHTGTSSSRAFRGQQAYTETTRFKQKDSPEQIGRSRPDRRSRRYDVHHTFILAPPD